MSFRRMARCPIQALCLLSLSASFLFAASISGGTASYSETLPFSRATTSLTGFSQYHGTEPLTAIEFLFVTNVSGTAIISDGPGPHGPNPTQTVTMNFSAALSLYDPSNTTVLLTSTPAATSLVTVPGNGTPVTATASASGVTTTAVLTNRALFSPFIGTGTFSLPFQGEAEVGFTPDLIIPFSVSDTGSANGTVEVLYQAVPEPSTASIFLLGGLGLCAASLLRPRLKKGPPFN